MITAEECLARMNDPSWYGEYDENGVNLTVIRANLKRTPEQRLRRGDRTARQLMELIAYVKQRTSQLSELAESDHE